MGKYFVKKFAYLVFKLELFGIEFQNLESCFEVT